MKIVAFKYEKIAGEKLRTPQNEAIPLKTNFEIGKVEKQTEEVDSKPLFTIDFIYTLEYSDVAIIEFKGKIYITIEKKDSKDLEKDPDKYLNKDKRSELLNFLLFKTHVEALRLEEIFNLPFHAVAPQIRIGDKDTSDKEKEKSK